MFAHPADLVRMRDVDDAPDGLDYDTVVTAVLESARGRWFLREHERRVRATETRTLLNAIRRLEGSLAPALAAREATDRQLETLALLLHEVKAGIAEIRHPLLEGGGAIPAGVDAFDFMSLSARSVASDVSGSAHALHSTSQSLRTAEAPEAETAALERQAAKLLTVAYRQEVLSQRVARAAGALSDIDQRLKGHLPKATTTPSDAQQPLTVEHLKYFKPDEEIFARPALAASRRPPKAPAQLPEVTGSPVVVVRKATGEIPFLNEDVSTSL
jgi:hypothetical protein